ncbi:MAG: hypothetical protein AB8B97_19970 [Granulosicoccus sp.]
MSGFRQGMVVVCVAAILLVQGCSFTAEIPDPEKQEAVLERWNRCLQRFDNNTAHFCDGHRRDVLATYPAHLENQIDYLLRQQIKSGNLRSVMKTTVGFSPNTSSPATRSPVLER